MYTLNIKGKRIVLEPRREGAVVESNGKNMLFLSQFMKNEEKWEKKEIIENYNDVRKGTMWNKPLTTSNGFTKNQSVLGIDSWPTLFKLANCIVSTHQRLAEHEGIPFDGL